MIAAEVPLSLSEGFLRVSTEATPVIRLLVWFSSAINALILLYFGLFSPSSHFFLSVEFYVS